MKRRLLTTLPAILMIALSLLAFSPLCLGKTSHGNHVDSFAPLIGAPTANAATSITSSSFFASWKSVSGATSYKIYVFRKILLGGMTQWMVVTGYNGLSEGGTNITVKGLIGGSDYKYYVTSFQLSDESDKSNEIMVSTSLDAPVASAGTDVTPVSFTASWSAVSGANSYKISVIYKNNGVTHLNDYTSTSTSYDFTGLIPLVEYKYGVVATNNTIDSPVSNVIAVTTAEAAATTVKAASSITGNSFIANWNAMPGATSYLLNVVDEDTQGFILKELVVTGTKYTVTGLKSNHPYRYLVKVMYGQYPSAFSAFISTATKPDAPEEMAATNITTTSFTANWKAVINATGYKLWVVSKENTGFNPAGYFPKSVGNVIFYNVTGLTQGHSYQYYIQTVTSLGESAASGFIEVTTKPTTPAAMNASNITSTSFTANWQTVISATGYKLYVWKKQGMQFVTGYNGKTITGTSESITGLSPETEYQYRLCALKNTTESDYSNTVDAKTSPQAAITFTLSVSPQPTLGGVVSGGGTFNQGTPVTAHAAPNNGYEFVNWTEGSTVVSTSASYIFSLNGNRTLIANFTLKTPVTEINDPEISLYPNPASETLTISGLKGKSTVSLFTPTGARIINRTGDENVMQIEVSQLKQGVYLVTIENGRTRTSRKIMVK